MKLSIIRNVKKNPNLSKGIVELMQAGAEQGVEVVIVDGSNDDISAVVRECEGVAMWRSGIKKNDLKKRNYLAHALREKGVFLIDEIALVNPAIADKHFQYDLIKEHTAIPVIPTWAFKSKQELEQSIREKKLSFPLIQKPRDGARGENIFLVKSLDEITLPNNEFSSTIFQPFIKNSGDFRVLFVGGVVVGIIKRIGQDGSHRNNVSQGSSTELVEKAELRESLTQLTQKVASVSKLDIFGLDILPSDLDGKLYFLEVNNLPQWQGFQQATGIEVAKEIITFVKRVAP